jgi:hypothetical protein
VEDDMASVRAIAPKIRALEVPAELRLIPGWLIWRFEQYPGEAKARKVPYWTDGTIRHGQQGSPTDRARLTPFAAARDAAARMGYSGVGFAPLPDFGYTFLDFDNCVGPSGEISPEIEQIVARTYAEFSPSGKGIRAALKGNLGNHKSPSTPEQFGFETFSTSMFVTFTGNILPACELIGLENTVATVDQHVIDLCERRFNGPLINNVVDPDDFMAGREPRLGLTPERMAELVNSLDPNMSRADWIRVGMALHHECDGDDTGFELWDEWSQDGYTYVSTEAMRVQWDSFERRKGSNRRQVTMASVIKMAKDAQSRPSSAASVAEAADALVADLDAPEGVHTPPGYTGKFPVLSADEISSQRPTDWLIKGVLPAADIITIYGASGSGKSFVVLDLAAAIATGAPWRGCKARKGRVVIIAAEGAGGYGKRIKALAQHRGIPLADLDIGVIVVPPNLMEEGDVTELAASIKAVGDVSFVVVDTFAQVTPGANENTGEDMGRALANVRVLSDVTDATVGLVHHSGKDASKGARGWSGIKAAMDAEIEITRDENTGARAIRLSKMKDGEDGTTWGFKLETVLLGLDDDGDDITSCVAVEDDVRPAATDDRKGVKRRGRHETHLLEVMATFPTDAIVRAEDLIRKACDMLPAPDAGKRDIRRQSVVRAIQNLSREKDGPLRMENGIVIFYE